mmetsp:Transcript_31144/g.75951  ORF Transcript_31144/g.75951 Transcript_31144/m.75951 type:complete len:978 (-) Transcript_31144:272-3205(-)
MSTYTAPRTNFGQPPPGYVPGLGRGAVGFTTRSDIGPARPAAGVDAPPGFQGGAPGAAQQGEKKNYGDSNFDKFSGFNENLFGGGKLDKEDIEADKIYAAIDRRMDSKRKVRREIRVKKELEEYRKKRPKIQEEFRDLKRELSGLSEADWESIPEPLDYSRRNRKKASRIQTFTPVPDKILRQAGLGAGQSQYARGMATPVSGMMTPAGWSTPTGFMTPGAQRSGWATPAGWQTPSGVGLRAGWATPAGYSTPAGYQTPGYATPNSGRKDLTQLGRARDKMLGIKLDRVADSVTGQTVIDPKGYLTDLNSSVKVQSSSDLQDIKKARLLLKSVIMTNPKHGPGWIAAARLEQETGKLIAARNLIMKGCDICPKCDDVWLEAAKMHDKAGAKAILAKAIRFVPTSKKIWLSACKYEEAIEGKKAVLRRALELIPHSVDLWKAAVELENPDDARIMLSRAVELVPTSVELWIALARLETYKNARKVLNRARKAIPTEPQIWITAAKLEEANENYQNVDTIIGKAVQSLAAHQVVIDRESWLQEAEKAERSQSKITCQAIVRTTIGIGIDEQDSKMTWLNDAEHYQSKGSVETTRAIYAHLLAQFPGKRKIWEKAAQFERQYGDSKTLDALLGKAVHYCPKAEVLWLMWAKEKWVSGDVDGARDILQRAFAANTDSEEVWVAAVKLEVENKEFTRARGLLNKARKRAGTERIWMKSAALERRLGNLKFCQELLNEGVNIYPGFDKLWMMLGQLHAGKGDKNASRKSYKQGVKKCPKSTSLWLCYANLEMDERQYAKARSLLETARMKIPKDAQLWLAAVRVEERAGNRKVAKQLMAKALQECSKSGILWSHAIATDPPPARKSRSYDALKRCEDDPHVFMAVAKLFWLDGKQRKARNWFNRATTVNPNLGDAWAWFYRFEKDHGRKSKIQRVLKKCIEAEPTHGARWCTVSKDVSNAGLKTEEILTLVEKALPRDLFAVE